MERSTKIAMVAMMLLLLSQTSSANQNSVYIDQVGSNSTIAVTQDGSGNKAGDGTTSMIISGTGQNISIQQVGSNNIAAVNVQGSSTALTTIATGSNNTVTLNCGSVPTTSCTDTTITANATGNSNTLTTTATAKSTISTTVIGNNNTATINSNTTHLLGARVNIYATGNSNTMSVNQSGPAGVAGFNAEMTVTGDSNTVGVTQTGTTDSDVQINSGGSNNSITVNSGN